MKVFTGSAPFNLYPSIAATLAIMRGERPPRPVHPGFTDGLWELMQRCWSQESNLRPDTPEILQVLESLLVSLSFHDSYQSPQHLWW